ncbi:MULTISPECIES: hypothetical protein [Tenacibaculum]|uniref:hypothetical protein n=1 Tax=Tenacibaculum TaxID=104267 RepID=UPI001F0B71A3|nr:MULTISPECIES: hypothetical protein [Tenacibaculum]MCH3881670.1 hypothetical protein [Tenacibaculum aquimarinum]MDO6598745.1 hypothetical protein [Tenacibaculum sp. 1_MG-2023]
MNNKIITIIVAVLSIIGIALFVLTLGVEEGNAEALSGSVSTLVTYSIILLIIAAAVAVLGSVFSLLKNPAALKKAGLGLVALLVVFGVAYMLANSDQVIDAKDEIIAAAGSQVSKLTSTGILFSGVLMLVAGAFFIIDLVKGLIKS